MEENRIITGDNAWMYNPPVNINAYDPTSDNATAAVRAVREAEWKSKITALGMFNRMCAGAKDLIIYGIGEYSVIAIKKNTSNTEA